MNMQSSRVKKRAVYRNRFIEFWGNMFNISGQMHDYEISDNPSRSDAEALASDWYKVGNDLRTAMDKYKESKEYKALKSSKTSN